MLGAYKLNTLSAVPATPVLIAGEWSTFSFPNILTNISQFTGIDIGSIGIHGVQNTNNLVLTLASQASPRTGNCWSITPVVVNLSTREIAKGATTPLVATNAGTNFLGAKSAGDHTGSINHGAVSLGHFDGTRYLHRIYGYTFGNWGSISSSNVPTLSLSPAYTDTTNLNSEAFLAYAGGSRWTAHWRDNAAGDLSVFRTFTYAGSGTPAAYSPKTPGGGNRGTGPISNWYAGISAGNVASHGAQGGNNANPLITHVHTGNATNSRIFTKGDVIPSDSRSGFNGVIARDVSGSNFFIHAANKGSTQTYEIFSGQVTNANIPTQQPAVTFGPVLGIAGGFGALVEGDRSTIIYRARYSSGTLRLTPLTLNVATRAVALGNEIVTTSGGTGNNAPRGWYHPTFGQWVIDAQWTGNINLNVSSLNI